MTYRVSFASPSVLHTPRGVRRDLQRAFGELFEMPASEQAEHMPPTDIIEDPTGWTLRLDLPGVSDEQLDVVAEERVLRVRARRDDAPLPEGGTALARERRTGTFSRQFRLPTTANPEQISAVLEHGELTLRVGKIAPAQPRRVVVQRPAVAASTASVTSEPAETGDQG